MSRAMTRIDVTLSRTHSSSSHFSGRTNVLARGRAGASVARASDDSRPALATATTNELESERENGELVKESRARASERKTWAHAFAEFKAFKAMYGTIEIPREYDGLRRWLARQRSAKRAGKLAETRVKELEAMGVTWELRKPSTRRQEGTMKTFAERERELAKYYAANGDGEVSEAQDEALAKWVSHQVASYRDGSLTEEKYDALSSLGVKFDERDERAVVRWDDRFAELKAYALAHDGSTRVPESSGDGLYFWLLEQRRAKKNGKLSAEKAQKLESVGVEWDIKPHSELPWGTRFTELTKFVRANGRFPSNSDDKSLFQWVRAQRKRYEQGMLEDDREAQLDSLHANKDWKIKPMSAFEKNLARLTTFVKANGHANVLMHDDKKLHAWLRKQRIRKRAGDLHKSRIQALEALGVQWTAAPTKLSKNEDPTAKLFGSAFQKIDSRGKKISKKN